ncbi:unnamed protein product [Eruca vesicaria subsp. sativa]|uniref:Uncharacterized protein n=1 Tax=Eruca vesicaria subsp. sativa TaxID=29727 RepID=A0ABC8KA34_ERUVS|nr:unnamed protein product [Eruca vesicaria subsp. sativa]
MASDSPLSQLTGGDGYVSGSPSSPTSSAIDFLSLCSRLKNQSIVLCGSLDSLTDGETKRDVKNQESIADHMYWMDLMALISSDIPCVNRNN